MEIRDSMGTLAVEVHIKGLELPTCRSRDIVNCDMQRNYVVMRNWIR